MRRAASLAFLVLAVALVLGGGLALAATRTGTNGGETLYGTPRADTIRAYGGDDVVDGRGGPDLLYGGKGSDRLYGGFGNYRIRSGGLDGKRDLVSCGAGRDFAAIAENDRAAKDCEVVAVTIE